MTKSEMRRLMTQDPARVESEFEALLKEKIPLKIVATVQVTVLKGPDGTYAAIVGTEPNDDYWTVASKPVDIEVRI